MLSGFFNYEHPIWRFVGKFWDVLVINVLWVVCSIPVFTIGASTTAMYYVTLQLVRDEEGYIVRSFFKSFKENFRQATMIWMIFLSAGAVLAFDLYYFGKLVLASTFRNVMLASFMVLAFIWMAMFTYVFSLQSRFYNSVKRTISNAFFMSVRHAFHTMGMLAADGVMAFLALTYVPHLLIFGVALMAFFNSWLLDNIFKRYIPREEKTEDAPLRPLFADEEDEARRAPTVPPGR